MTAIRLDVANADIEIVLWEEPPPQPQGGWFPAAVQFGCACRG